jgi:hypothetical protein
VAIMLVCGVLLVGGIAAGVRWADRPFASPAPSAELAPLEVARRFTWYAALALTGGVISGITVIGAGGRLAMRLLAVTGGDQAQRRITEADEVVGEITVGGTVGFVLFVGIFGGVIGAALYLVVRRFLPPGWLGGAAFGLALLVVLGTTVDPLRPENPDFEIVGPGWVAVLVFGALAVAYGVSLAAVVQRLSEWLPLVARDRGVLLRYALPAVIAVPAFSVTIGLVVVGLAVVATTRWRPIVDAVRSRRWVLGGRVVLLVIVAAALPNAVSNLVDIGTR